jgi:endonuclease/exonuclease/phosphatase family metal-dependent hydrolase
LLETLKDDTDIIMIQEPPRYFIKNIPSGENQDGTPEHDTCHHSQWSKIYFHTNVSVYINLSVLKTHNLFLLPHFDNNIIAFTLQRPESEERHHFINCYNDNDQPTLQRLLDFLEREDLANLTLMGDFNLHSPEWDLEVDRASARAKALSDITAKAGLYLLNDSDKPTWTQAAWKDSECSRPCICSL